MSSPFPLSQWDRFPILTACGFPASGEPRRATGGSPIAETTQNKADFVPPDPEVPEKAKRRRFSADYKLCILQEVDQTSEPGQIGAILRREGLYSSHLATWSRQRAQGLIDTLSPKKLGKKGRNSA